MQSLQFDVVDVACHCGNGKSFRECHGLLDPESAYFGEACDRLVRLCLAHSLPANQYPLYKVEPFVSAVAAARDLATARAGLASALVDSSLDALGHASLPESGAMPQLPRCFTLLVAHDVTLEHDGEESIISQGVHEAKCRSWLEDTGEVIGIEIEDDTGDKHSISQEVLFELIRDNIVFLDSIRLGLTPVLAFRYQ